MAGSLLGSVQKMMLYLHQSEVQLKGEVAIRGHFLQTLHEQQDLVDALTTVCAWGMCMRAYGYVHACLWGLGLIFFFFMPCRTSSLYAVRTRP